MLFSELSIKEDTLKALKDMGFEDATEIQEKSIPLLIADDIDYIGQAQTGTGKTAAFGIPLLEKIDYTIKAPQALVIAPTRELANQIKDEMSKIAKYDRVKTVAIYGGVPLSNQIREIKRDKPEVIIGTPGRLCDLLNRGVLNFAQCKFVVLDEADEMLDMGFFEDVQSILATVENKKIWMFSATMPKEILKLINKFFSNPQMVKVTKKVLTSDQIEQKYCIVRRGDRAAALARFLDFTQDVYGIVFTRTKIGAKELTDDLIAKGFQADALHGDMSQEQRDIAMRRFKKKKIRLLICTDVAARGIDVNDLTHVINFSLPQDNESYIHRIGRTGRGTSKGIALSIIDPSEENRLKTIERLTKAQIKKIKLPTVESIQEVLIQKSLSKFDELSNDDLLKDDNYEKFAAKFEDKEKEDVIKNLYQFVFDENLKKYSNARSLDVDSRSSARGKDGSRSDQAFSRFHMNIGTESGIDVGPLINFVATSLGINGSLVGKITLRPEFSFFELPAEIASEAQKLNGQSWKGKSVVVQVAKERPRGGSPRGGSGAARRGGARRKDYSRNGSSGNSGAKNRNFSAKKTSRPKRSYTQVF